MVVVTPYGQPPGWQVDPKLFSFICTAPGPICYELPQQPGQQIVLVKVKYFGFDAAAPPVFAVRAPGRVFDPYGSPPQLGTAVARPEGNTANLPGWDVAKFEGELVDGQLFVVAEGRPGDRVAGVVIRYDRSGAPTLTIPTTDALAGLPSVAN